MNWYSFTNKCLAFLTISVVWFVIVVNDHNTILPSLTLMFFFNRLIGFSYFMSLNFKLHLPDSHDILIVLEIGKFIHFDLLTVYTILYHPQQDVNVIVICINNHWCIWALLHSLHYYQLHGHMMSHQQYMSIWQYFLTLISRWYELIPQSRTNDVTSVMRYVSSIFYLFIFYNQFTNNLIWLSPIIINILCQYHHVF